VLILQYSVSYDDDDDDDGGKGVGGLWSEICTYAGYGTYCYYDTVMIPSVTVAR